MFAWPWGQQSAWAQAYNTSGAPVKEEYIAIDANTGFYPDHRQGIHGPGDIVSYSQYLAAAAVRGQYPGYGYGAAQQYPWYGNYSNYYNYYGGQPSTAGYGPSGYYYNNQWFPAPAPAGTHYSYSSPYYQPSTYPYYHNWTSPQASWPPSWYSQYYKNLIATRPSPLWSQYSYMQHLVPGGPSMLPMPVNHMMMQSQTGMAAAANAALAAMPQGPNYYVGYGATDYAAQQAYLMQHMGYAKPPPSTMVPYKPSSGTQFWCKETDGSWTLRGQDDISLGDLSPGHWEQHTTSGYWYWVRDNA